MIIEDLKQFEFDFEDTINIEDIDEVDLLIKKGKVKTKKEIIEIELKEGLKKELIKIFEEKNTIQITTDSIKIKDNKLIWYGWIDYFVYSKNINITNDPASRARRVNITKILKTKKRDGKILWADDDSIIFYRDQKAEWRFMDKKTSEKASIIDFCMKYFKMSLKEAIKYLLDNNTEEDKQKIKKDVKIDFKAYIEENKNPNNYGMYRYLYKVRGIDFNIFKKLENEGFLYRNKRLYTEECDKYLGKDTTCTMFVYKNPFTQEITGLTERQNSDSLKMKKFWDEDRKDWVYGKPFRKNFSGCEWGFNYLIGEPKTIKIFEAPLDMLSYWTINKNNIKDTLLVALGGLNKKILINILEYKDIKEKLETIYVNTDNDEAGESYYNWVLETYKDKYTINREIPIGGYKDWNEVIMKKEEQELIKRR